MLADCASGPVLVIFEGSFEDLSPESRAMLREFLSLGAKPLSQLLEHYGSWEAVAESFAGDFSTEPPSLDA
jgi:hypothetical protein